MNRQHAHQAGTERRRRRNGHPLHHTGIARHIFAELVQGPIILCLQFRRQGGGVYLIIENLGGFQVIAGLVVKMSQHNGGLVVALHVGHAGGQGLATLQIELGGIKTERKILLRRYQFQLVPTGRIGGSLRQVPVHVHLVLQLAEQLLRLFVRTDGRKAGGRQETDRHQS